MLRPDVCPGPVVAAMRRLGAWLADLAVELIRIDMESQGWEVTRVQNDMQVEQAELEAAAKEWAQFQKWKRLREAWYGVRYHLKAAVKTVPELRRAWPGLWFVLSGLMPIRVWSTWGPPGHGPSGATPEEAAGVIKWLSETDLDDNPEEAGPVATFTPEELRRLWYPGAKIVRGGWGIKCTLIPRWAWGQFEWDGF